MDKRTLNTVAAALQWEARYLKGEHLAGKGAFLPDLDIFDQDLAKALECSGIKSGKLLEIGTGAGVQAIRYAQAGFKVTATDVSVTAMEYARKKAAEEGVDPTVLTFVADNILMSRLQGAFDVISDRGCYTLLPQGMREDYCRNVHRLLNPGGFFFLKADAKGEVNSLATHFQVVQSWDSYYHGERRQGPKAGFYILKPLNQ